MKIKKIAIILLAVALLVLAACAPEVETITRKEGNYKYSLSETVEIVNVEDNEVIGYLTVDSCELVSDKPFVIDYYRESTRTDENGNKTVVETVETKKFAALYKVSFTFIDSLGNVGNASKHFDSTSNKFVINPYGEDMQDGFFYVGVLNDNNGESFISLDFTYDLLQTRHTALFKLQLENHVPSHPDLIFKGLDRIRVDYYDVF